MVLWAAEKTEYHMKSGNAPSSTSSGLKNGNSTASNHSRHSNNGMKSAKIPNTSPPTFSHTTNKPPNSLLDAKLECHKPTYQRTNMSTTARYALEKEYAGTTTYYVSRIKWTQYLAAATLFQNPDHAHDEIQLLPDGYELGVKVRTIQLTPGRIVK